MITLAPSIAAVILGALAFAAFVLQHREAQTRRRAVEEQASAETKAKAIRTEVADALETLNAKVRRLESEVLSEDGGE